MKTEKIENPVNQAGSIASGEPKKTAKEKKTNKAAEGGSLPVLVEFTYTISILLLIILSFTIILVSLLHGASLFAIVLRTSVVIFVMGSLLAVISSQVSSGLLFSSRIEQEELEKKQARESGNSADIEKQKNIEV
jgi:hypothetical protein